MLYWAILVNRYIFVFYLHKQYFLQLKKREKKVIKDLFNLALFISKHKIIEKHF